MTEANGTASTAIIPSPDNGDQAIAAFSSESNFKTAQRMAKALSESSLVPTAYKGNLPNVLIAMELASRVGASVFAVMQNLDIIHGNPSWRAKFLIATVNACGRFTPLRFRWQGVEGTDTWGCRCVAKDKDGEECLGALITISLAKEEGWFSKNGSKWKTMPEQMLMYRSAAFWTRIYAPELSLGMSTSDEVQDVYGSPGVVVTQLPTALVPGSTKDLEAELLGKPIEKPEPVVLDMPVVDYHPDTGEIVPS